MEYRTLGRTGLKVSVIGIGTGGPSNFGQSTGVPEADIVRLTRRALDLGINFFDTSAAYGESEAILGRALNGVPRDRYILATKFHAVPKTGLITPDQLVESVENSLRRLQVDEVEVMQFHGLDPPDYRDAVDTLLPTVLKLQEQGKLLHIGASETYSRDPRHEMFPMALQEDWMDTAMVGYNLMSPTAEQVILPGCLKKNVGVICMVAVRRALSRPELLEERIADAKSKGLIAEDAVSDEDPLGWLISDEVKTLPAAGYKFAAMNPAIHTVLSGTANIEHLDANVEAILGPPLSSKHREHLRQIFGEVWEPIAN